MAEIISQGWKRGIPGNLELPLSVERLPNGNTLISDGGDEAGFGSEVIEVDPLGNIVWQFDDLEGLKFTHSARRMKNGNTLITDTNNNRLLEVTPDKKIVMNSDDWGGGTGRLSDGSHLHYPNEAFELEDGTFLVTDRNNDRCLQVNGDGRVSWSFGEKELHHPHNANPLSNGNILVSDSDGNRIIEVNRNKEIVWSYGDGSIEMLWWPRSAIRLPNGNTLITDTKNHRLLEVAEDGRVVWRFQTEHVDTFYLTHATSGETFLTSSVDGHHQVIEIDRACNYVWTFRNYRRPFPLFSRLINGFFKTRAENGQPEHWTLATRLSEGGGKLLWDEQNKPRPCPGIELDRDGALFLQQAVALEPGVAYRIGAEIRAEDVEGSACLQMDFFDAYGGSMFQDITRTPMGEIITGSTHWIADSFEFRVPPHATYGELRLFLNNRGRAFIKNVMLNRI
jgi:hypothetical protein